MTRIIHGLRQLLSFCFLKRWRQHGGRSSYFQCRVCTAHIFRRNNMLTGQYKRKRNKEKGKEEQEKIRNTQEQKWLWQHVQEFTWVCEARDAGMVRPTLTSCSRESRGLRGAALPGDPNVVSAPNQNSTYMRLGSFWATNCGRISGWTVLLTSTKSSRRELGCSCTKALFKKLMTVE